MELRHATLETRHLLSWRAGSVPAAWLADPKVTP